MLRRVSGVVLIGSIFPTVLLAHSGGLDQFGCHAGSQPYHCHNNPVTNSNSAGSPTTELSGWDLNFGVRFPVNGPSRTSIYPYLGFSVGESTDNDQPVIGVDVGISFENYFYVGYVTTSKTLQLGFRPVHVSIGDELVGIGLRLPLGQSKSTSQDPYYFSASALY
jgi:hypothetical protein